MSEAPAGRVASMFLGLGLGEAVGRALAFLTTILLARRLGSEGYGTIAVALAVGLYLAKGVECGQLGVGVTAIAAGERDAARLASAVNTIRLALAALATAVAGFVAWFALPEPESFILPLYFFALFPLAVDSSWVLVGLERGTAVARARVAAEATMLLAVFFFVDDIGDLPTAALIFVLGATVSSSLLWSSLSGLGLRCRILWDPELALPLLRRGAPIAGQILLGLLIFNSDLLFLRVLVGREEVGLYAAAYTPISFVVNLAYTYSQAVLPVLSAERSEGRDGAELFADSHIRAYSLALPFSVGTAILALPLIELGFGAEYRGGGWALAWLAASVPFATVTAMAWPAMTVTGQQNAMFGATAKAAALNAVLNLLLIPVWGLSGAAIATGLTEAARAALMSRLASREGLKLPGWRRFVRPSVAVLVMGGALLGLEPGVWLGVPLGVAVYGSALFLFGGVGMRDGRPALLD